MADAKLLEAYRQVLGQGLKELRTSKGISTYAIRQKTNLSGETIKQIEEGSANYTIDSFFQYIQAIDVYIFFSDKAGKKDTPLDLEHLTKKMRQDDPERSKKK
jgi:transcriptional regulator with XRE-family HTH domain